MTRATLFSIVPFSVYLLLVILISLPKNSTNLLLEVQSRMGYNLQFRKQFGTELHYDL